MEGRVERLTCFDHKKNVLYLMQRDHRVYDNYSLLLSYDLSYNKKTQLYIGTDVSAIKKNNIQEAFMYEGLVELNKKLMENNINFFIISNIEKCLEILDIDCVVTDYSPLREVLNYQNNLQKFCRSKSISLYICDSHNIVPCKLLNEYVKTPKAVKARLYKHWHTYFKDFEPILPHKYNTKKFNLDKDSFIKFEDYEIPEIKNYTKFVGGYTAGMKKVQSFLTEKLSSYKKLRNTADLNFISDLSPWIHFGQISTQKVLIEAHKKAKIDDENLACFCSEIFAWKEIAEHFCLHEKNYDNINGALPWAKETLKTHATDKRDKIYTFEQLEKGLTHDDEWNSGQKEMVITGKMHGYVRMYWAKKLLHWTVTPEQALEYAIVLNDKYSIDGNDPNGYLGIMWSICGSMDQGWGEQEIYGKIRGMKGIRAKNYVKKWKNIKIK